MPIYDRHYTYITSFNVDWRNSETQRGSTSHTKEKKEKEKETNLKFRSLVLSMCFCYYISDS